MPRKLWRRNDFIGSQLNAFFRTTKPFTAGFGQLSYQPDRHFYKLPILVSEAFTIHKSLLTLIQPFRKNSIRTKDIVKIEAKLFSRPELKMLSIYGYAQSDKTFELHVTVGSVERTEQSSESNVFSSISSMLSRNTSEPFPVREIYAEIVLDAIKQEDFKTIWSNQYQLR